MGLAAIYPEIAKISLSDIKKLPEKYGGEGKVKYQLRASRVTSMDAGKECSLEEFSPTESKEDIEKYHELEFIYGIEIDLPFGVAETRIGYDYVNSPPVEENPELTLNRIVLNKNTEELPKFLKDFEILDLE